jgi:hypothetical protein
MVRQRSIMNVMSVGSLERFLRRAFGPENRPCDDLSEPGAFLSEDQTTQKRRRRAKNLAFRQDFRYRTSDSCLLWMERKLRVSHCRLKKLVKKDFWANGNFRAHLGLAQDIAMRQSGRVLPEANS